MSAPTLPPEIEAALEKYATAYRDTHDTYYGHHASSGEARQLSEAYAAADATLRTLLAPLVADAERYRYLRDLPCCLYILTKDEHRTGGQTVADYIEYDPFSRLAHVSEDEKARMIAADHVWELQVYPSTPIGFNLHVGHSLDAAIDAARGAA